MISATDALLLPSAKLTDEERAAVALIMAEIDSGVRLNMKRHGCEVKIHDTRKQVIAEVNQQLKAQNWNSQWNAIIEKSSLTGLQTISGYMAIIAPSDDAYRAADDRIKA